MIITYQRVDNLDPHQLDPQAPGADVAGIEWRCTRAPHPGEDEHRAAFERDVDGPDGAVRIAWTYQYARDLTTIAC